MKVKFNTIYDERVSIFNVEAINDCPDALQFTSKLGSMLSVYLDAPYADAHESTTNPLLNAEAVFVYKDSIKHHIEVAEG